MGWERRGSVYCLYHTRRADGRVVKDYLGSGHAAQLAADLIAEARDCRASIIKARKAEQDRLDYLDGAVDRLDRACDLMTEAALTAWGLTDARRRRRGTAAAAGADRRPR